MPGQFRLRRLAPGLVRELAALGAAAAAIGIAEFGGEGLVVATVDRLGKTNALMIGVASNGLATLLLPLAGRTMLTAVAGLALFYLTFEYTVVSMLPVMSEILPRSRATLLAFYAASFSLGRALGSLASPRLYALGSPPSPWPRPSSTRSPFSSCCGSGG